MKFKDFLCNILLEGGSALEGVSKITQLEVKRVVPAILERLKSELPGVKISLVGSAGKKPDPHELSGDLDFVVETSSENVAKVARRIGKSAREMPGINVYSFSYPVDDKLVQVDLIPVDNIKFAEWSYQANPEDLKLGLKGAQRNEIFFAIAKHLTRKVLKTVNKEPVVIERFFYDLSKGLMVGTQSREGRAGKLNKNYSTLEKKVITSDPSEITYRMFGSKVSSDDVSTFAGALHSVKSKEFAYPEIREEILKTTLVGIKKKGLKIPKGL